MFSRCLVFLLSLPICLTVRAAGVAEHIVLVVWDGMRPDFVTPELTPTLWQLRTNGVWFDRHHPVYPSSTEVNGTALSTGAHPQKSGILANVEFRPAINARRPINTESIVAIRRGDELTDNHYLAIPTLAEMIQQEGLRTAIAGTKPVAALHDRGERTGENPPGLILFANAALPASLWPQLTNRFGAPPRGANPNTARDEWTTRCLIEGLWSRGVPKFSLLWLSEPDSTQHQRSPGAAQSREAIRGADQNLALVLAELERRGLRGRTDVIVVSDHGFSTIASTANISSTLRRAGLNASRSWRQPPADDDMMVVGNGGTVLIYVVGHKPELIQKAVAVLQGESGVGVIFTRNALPGTFPLKEIKLDAPHEADIVVSMRWQAGRNRYDAPGLATQEGPSTRTGGGMHVTLGPTDMHNTCVANGPDFRRDLTNSIASGNVDITPTLLWLLDIKPTQPRDGRVLMEALTSVDAKPPVIEHRKLEARAELPGGVWSQYLSYTEVNGTRYFDEGNGSFTTNAPTWNP